MKKILCFLITASLVLTSSSVVFAKQNQSSNQSKKSVTEQETTSKKDTKIKANKQSFKIKGAKVIKYGKYKLPISPITKGMGATVNFDKETAILTVEKATTKIVINFKEKTVTVNGVADTNSGIFTAKNDKKMTVLIKYIANALGVRVTVGKDKITTEIPGLNAPTLVTVTTVGNTVVANTLNNTNLYMYATANVVAGQATGGKAELYVGSKLVATDTSIVATDTTVTFTTSDTTPVNSELQAAIPVSGVVTVKLYNASNSAVVSAVANPTLTVDYVSPAITSITGAIQSVSGSAITIIVSGAGEVNDKVDVTKISLYDTTLNKTYQLTNTAGTGSVGVVSSTSQLTITLGTVDKQGLSGFGGSTVLLTIAPGSLLIDSAGNTSAVTATAQTIPVTIIH
jgi:hypothetical protein